MIRLFLSFALSGLVLQCDVLTANYDNSRTGATTTETILTPTLVSSQFGRLGSWSVDGCVYAQPLYVSGSTNRIFVATDHSSIYALNADSPGSSALWSVNLATSLTFGGDFVCGRVGCTATPVINNGVLYAVCVNSANVWKLYSLNISDGSAFHAPVTISGTANGGLTFDGSRQQARAGLLAANGNIYFAFGSYGDSSPWQGWIFSYDAITLAQSAIFCTVNSSTGKAGIWMTGGGIAADGSGNIYLTVGNGDFDGTNNFGECVLKLSSTLTVLDYLVDSAWATYNAIDADQGSGRVILAGTRLMTGGKNGYWWVADQSNLGHVQNHAAPSSQVQAWSNQISLFDATAFANNALYTIDNEHVNASLPAGIQKNVYNGATFTTSPSASQFSYPTYLSGIAHSSNGAANGILWVNSCETFTPSALTTGALRAFNASDLTLLYDSTAKAGHAVGNCAKYSSPTVANGKVYVGTFSNSVVAFGPIRTSLSGAVKLSGGATIQ